MALPNSIKSIELNTLSNSIKSLEVEPIHKLENELLFEVQNLANNPIVSQVECSIKQVIGDSSPVAAWDLVPLSIQEVADATQSCKVYGKLFRAVKDGVLNTKDTDISKFKGVFDSLYIEHNVLHFGSRIVIPTKFHERLLSELHASHIGVNSMKKVVRDIFWWPGITKSIETIAAKCEGCRKYKKNPPPNTLSVWPSARRPMERVHVDFFEF